METQNLMNSFVKETGGYAASQLEACTRCGMCAEACHFYQATGNPEYAPVWKIELLKRAYEQHFHPRRKTTVAQLT
jgi:Fe-S oxidoreductase